MYSISNIIKDISHRPYQLPSGRWRYYQEWNHAIFLHYKIPLERLRPLVPAKLPIDLFDGDCYVSVVPFTMQKIRPRFFPALNPISDFHEINVRTYINHDGKQGVYFLNIEAGKTVSAFVARALSGLPYEKSTTKRTVNAYYSVNSPKDFSLDVVFRTGAEIRDKTPLDRWLTERYCLFLQSNNGTFRYDIHHKEWQLRSIEINKLICNYQLGNLNLSELSPDKIHYSDGVKVLAWKKVKL